MDGLGLYVGLEGQSWKKSKSTSFLNPKHHPETHPKYLNLDVKLWTTNPSPTHNLQLTQSQPLI